jgi:hypothetical protein
VNPGKTPPYLPIEEIVKLRTAESCLQLPGGAIWPFFRICNVLETGVEPISGVDFRRERQKAGAPEMQLGNLLHAERRYPTP